MIEIERLVTPHTAASGDESRHDRALRPKYLEDYIGQAKIREQLQIFIRAALARQEALDHVLIFGPPGLGKTTLAHVIAAEMGVNIKQTSGPVIERAGDLAALLTHLKPHDILFIDEIHRLSPAIEEILYPALEDYRLDIMIGEGPGARTVKIDLPPFTLIGATTRAGMLTHPLRDRFGIVLRLVFYDTVDLQTIVMRSARLLPCPVQETGAREIALRSRGTPRIANRLLRRVRDFIEVEAVTEVSAEWVDKALTMLDVDQYGLDWLDRRFLQCLVERFQGGPVGLDSLASVMGEERATIEDVIEPFLLQRGFIQRTHRGRVATAQTYTYLGLPGPHDTMENDAYVRDGDDAA